MKRKPNVLLFMPDGMQANVARPESDCKTPNFDRLAGRGVRFNRAHTVLPTCSPARASLMTGLLPHNHAVLQVEHCVDDDQCVLRTQYPHWAQRLQQAGYRTGYFGKWHIERTNRLEDFGWQVNGCDETAAFRAIGEGDEFTDKLLDADSFAKYTVGPEGYNTVLHYGVTDVPTKRRRFAHAIRNARRFVRKSGGRDAPWACCVSFAAPNTPVVAGRAAFERYDVDAIRLPENLRDDHADKPGLYRRQGEILAHMTDRQWRELRAVYFALVTELDQEFGTLLDELEQSGELENTVVIVVADHGRYLGAHGFDNHNFGAFEEAYNIPLIVCGPGIARGVETDALVSTPDLCPTILELTGSEPMDASDSQSFAPVLADPQKAEGHFNTSYAEFHGTRFILTQRILWEGDWKLVFNGFDYDELYNLRDDPHELRNLAGAPGQQEQLRAMMAKLWHRLRITNDRALLETHYSPMRFAAVGPNVARA